MLQVVDGMSDKWAIQVCTRAYISMKRSKTSSFRCC